MYVFLVKLHQITGDKSSLLRQFLHEYSEVLIFTGAGYVGYLSETKKDIVSPFFYKRYKNKKPYPCKFFCYEVPEKGIMRLKYSVQHFVYSSKYYNHRIEVKNFIGYIDKEYIEYSHFFSRKQDNELTMILSGVSKLIYDELIPNKERFV